MNHTLDYFSYQSAMYDLYQVNCVPKYEEVTGVATNFLNHVLPGNDPVSVLDLGCGTGNTTQKLREVAPCRGHHLPGRVCTDAGRGSGQACCCWGV